MNTITYCGHTLTWEEHSPGEHTFIFIHGYSSNRAIWKREVELFAARGRCVTLDLPGHYPATAPREYRRLAQAELLDLELHAINTIAGGKPCTIVGHSTGGLVALAAAALLPECVTRVIALAPVVWGPLDGLLGLYQRIVVVPGSYPFYWLNYRLTQLSYRYIQWGIATYYSGDPAGYRHNPLAAHIVRGWYPAYRRSRLRNFAVLLQTLANVDIRPLLSSIHCPVLVIAGARDPVVPIEQSRHLAASVNDVTYLEISNSGHLPHWEAAGQVDAMIAGWLADQS